MTILAEHTTRRSPIRPLTAYGVMIVAVIAVFWNVKHLGDRWYPDAVKTAAATVGAESHAASPLAHVLLAIASLILLGRLLGVLLRWFHQPPVIGEVLAGILLGPSFLGHFWPEASAFLLPKSTVPSMSILAQIGVILYMFCVGLEFNAAALRGRGQATIAISHTGIAVPFMLGALLALAIYPAVSSRDVPFFAFALFLGAAMSVTAFPVLARILSDRNMQRTPLGVMALTCAAADDASAWCLLAFVVGVAKSDFRDALLSITLTGAFLVLAFGVFRPALHRFGKSFLYGEPSSNRLAIALAGLLISALATEQIGIHSIFGAFVFGAVIPHDSALARRLLQIIPELVSIVFLPAFFALTGMRTEIGLISGHSNLLICLAILTIATLGKFGGTTAAARIWGMNWRDAAGMGVLMNTRGLMELIVLNIGLDMNIISPLLFAMMVIMAVVTTLATSPILAVIQPPGGQADASKPSSTSVV